MKDMEKRGVCSHLINLENFRNYNKLLRVTSRILASAESKSLRSIGNDPKVNLILAAETLWVKSAQRPLMKDWERRFKRLGHSITNEGVLTVGSRISRWLRDNWNKECFILLPAKHLLTRLIVEMMHQRDHGGIEVTLARLQTKFWVPGARRMIKTIKDQCITCKKLLKRTETQAM